MEFYAKQITNGSVTYYHIDDEEPRVDKITFRMGEIPLRNVSPNMPDLTENSETIDNNGWISAVDNYKFLINQFQKYSAVKPKKHLKK